MVAQEVKPPCALAGRHATVPAMPDNREGGPDIVTRCCRGMVAACVFLNQGELAAVRRLLASNRGLAGGYGDLRKLARVAREFEDEALRKRRAKRS